MYERPEYSGVASAEVVSLLAANPLALVVTTQDGIPVGTHAPVLLRHCPGGIDDDNVESETAALVGSLLVGHMNVENPQWQSMRDGDRALVVFQGPHGYVSPVTYASTPAAPTWNFTAVHCTGRLRPTADRDAVLEVVRETVRRLEASFGRGWSARHSQDYFYQLAAGVGAFEVEVDDVQTMFKLSQEQAPEQRRRVSRYFQKSDSPVHRRLAALMETLGIVEPNC